MKRLHIIAGVALLTLFTAGGAAVAVAQAPETSAAGTCQVTVDRTQAAGTFSVNKQTLESGSCVCAILTGPASQDSSVEAQIADVQTRGDCGVPVAPAQAAAAAGGGSNVPLYVAGGIGLAGGAAALASGGGNNDSTGG